jgi:hypothetical protein
LELWGQIGQVAPLSAGSDAWMLKVFFSWTLLQSAYNLAFEGRERCGWENHLAAVGANEIQAVRLVCGAEQVLDLGSPCEEGLVALAALWIRRDQTRSSIWWFNVCSHMKCGFMCSVGLVSTHFPQHRWQLAGVVI